MLSSISTPVNCSYIPVILVLRMIWPQHSCSALLSLKSPAGLEYALITRVKPGLGARADRLSSVLPGE